MCPPTLRPSHSQSPLSGLMASYSAGNPGAFRPVSWNEKGTPEGAGCGALSTARAAASSAATSVSASPGRQASFAPHHGPTRVTFYCS